MFFSCFFLIKKRKKRLERISQDKINANPAFFTELFKHFEIPRELFFEKIPHSL